MLTFDPPLPSLSSIAGRSAVVTGAAQGIGYGIASALAHLGAEVVAIDRDAAALEASFGDSAVHQVVADMHDANPAELAESALARKSPIELIVNNVGIASEKDFASIEPGDFDRVMRVNLRGPWFFTRRLVEELTKANRPGAVVFISSLHDTFVRLQPDYSASKAATAMLVKELAYELARDRIRVNAVSPGAIESASVRVDATAAAAAGELIPLGRIGRPEDVARAAVALLSDEIGLYVTGANLRVDGGLGLHSWAMD